MTLRVPILTKIVHAAHDWQHLKGIAVGSVWQCSRCSALKAGTVFESTLYTVPDCKLEDTNHWYPTEQVCYTWGVTQEGT